jgi:hypothetical protein
MSEQMTRCPACNSAGNQPDRGRDRYAYERILSDPLGSMRNWAPPFCKNCGGLGAVSYAPSFRDAIARINDALVQLDPAPPMPSLPLPVRLDLYLILESRIAQLRTDYPVPPGNYAEIALEDGGFPMVISAVRQEIEAYISKLRASTPRCCMSCRRAHQLELDAYTTSPAHALERFIASRHSRPDSILILADFLLCWMRDPDLAVEKILEMRVIPEVSAETLLKAAVWLALYGDTKQVMSMLRTAIVAKGFRQLPVEIRVQTLGTLADYDQSVAEEQARAEAKAAQAAADAQAEADAGAAKAAEAAASVPDPVPAGSGQDNHDAEWAAAHQAAKERIRAEAAGTASTSDTRVGDPVAPFWDGPDDRNSPPAGQDPNADPFGPNGCDSMPG